MIKKYISKFTIDIAPSIIATIVGAYIVNHYIAPKNDEQKPAAAVAAPEQKPAAMKPADLSADVGNILDAAPAKAAAADKNADKAVIEKASIDKASAEKAGVEKTGSDRAGSEKAGFDKGEVISEPRRHTPIREKVAKVAPAPATVGTAPSDPASDDRRDANDLARAAIERLNREQPRVQEAVRAAPQQAQPMQQLPPPIVLATPSVESLGQSQGDRPDSRRPRPPGEIPTAYPDLQADASSVRRERTNVAEDVLSAAKSVFHTVTRPFDR